MTQSEIGICGGGFIGLLAANLLADQGLSVKLFTENKPKYDASLPMVHALNDVGHAMLSSMAIEMSYPKTPMYTMQVYDEQHDFVWRFDAQQLGKPNLGYIVSVSALLTSLFQRAEKQSNIQIFQGKLTAPLTWQDDLPVITDSQDTRHQLSWLIGADGPQSWVRQQLKIPVVQQDPKQIGIIAKVSLQQPQPYQAWQKFLTTGPIALLPDQTCTEAYLIWSVAADYGRSLMAMSSEEFCEVVQQVTSNAFGHIQLTTLRYQRPLKTQLADSFFKSRCMLVGDAAHTILPLFGQGANLGCLDLQLLMHLLRSNDATDYWQVHDLMYYEDYRRKDALFLGQLAHGLNKASTKPQSLLANIRGLTGSFMLSLPCAQSNLLAYAKGSRPGIDRPKYAGYWPVY